MLSRPGGLQDGRKLQGRADLRLDPGAGNSRIDFELRAEASSAGQRERQQRREPAEGTDRAVQQHRDDESHVAGFHDAQHRTGQQRRQLLHGELQRQLQPAHAGEKEPRNHQQQQPRRPNAAASELQQLISRGREEAEHEPSAEPHDFTATAARVQRANDFFQHVRHQHQPDDRCVQLAKPQFQSIAAASNVVKAHQSQAAHPAEGSHGTAAAAAIQREAAAAGTAGVRRVQ